MAPIGYCYYLEPDRCLGTFMVRRSEANGALDDSASVAVSRRLALFGDNNILLLTRVWQGLMRPACHMDTQNTVF